MYYRLYFDADTICIGSNKVNSDFKNYYVASEDFYLGFEYNPIGKPIREIYEASRQYIKVTTAMQKHTIRECTSW